MNVWTAWKVGMRTKTGGDGSRRAVFRELARNLHRPERLSWTLRPMDFLRYREFDFSLRAISNLPKRPKRILDLSSPKLLPLTLASNFPDSECISTDILEREVNWTRGKADLLNLANLEARQEDARELKFPSDRFDLVTSISVFEHIAPEIDGDLPAIREMSRVLRPGGFAIITVPASRNYMADFQNADVYERKAGEKPNFFQRFYTRQMLQRNFVETPGLELVSLKFVEERYFSPNPRHRVAHWVNCSPTQNTLFGPLYPLLSHVFLSEPKPWEKCDKPYIACMVLRKPLPPLRLAA